MEEVAEMAGLRVESVNTRARNMRTHGVPLIVLPKLKNPVPRKSNVKDDEYWADMAKKHAKLLKEAKEKGLSGKQLRLLTMENRSNS